MPDRSASEREGKRLAELRGESDPYGAAIRSTRMPIVICDATLDDCPIVFANDAFVSLSGYPREEIIGRNCRFLQGPETDRAEVARVSQAIVDGSHVETEILNYRKDGTPFWNALFISPVHDADGRVTHFFGSQVDMTARNRAASDLAAAKADAEALVAARTADLQKALDQKTVLLHEVDHRVKNNLQLISSLILLQSRRIADPEIRDTMTSMLNRVSALATVHRNLFQADDLSAFDVPAFMRDIASDLLDASGRDDLSVEHDHEPAAIPAQQASAVALIVNELLIEALACAPESAPGRLRLAVRRPDGELAIEVDHDGSVEPGQSRESFGASLMSLLTRQLSATIERSGADDGPRVRLTMPVADRPAS
ncbi:PAS domain-containing protein [Chenggangzhangella methanolivorans]|uniref:PAS domain-containing protein n=2 Tax=Chenggangzhangella methanolivorans TaxID=1437009 RepID=UPI003609C27F